MSEAQLPFSQACENNKPWILDILVRHLGHRDRPEDSPVLEIGSGTGQHAVHFAEHLPHLTWQTTDVVENLQPLNRRLRLAALPNLPLALELDVRNENWPVERAGHVFSANSLHIMSGHCMECLFRKLPDIVNPGSLVFFYGPFRYNGEYTSDSNAGFDRMLRSRDPDSGIRDFEEVDSLAREAGLEFVEDNDMPANNQLLVWRAG